MSSLSISILSIAEDIHQSKRAQKRPAAGPRHQIKFKVFFLIAPPRHSPSLPPHRDYRDDLTVIGQAPELAQKRPDAASCRYLDKLPWISDSRMGAD